MQQMGHEDEGLAISLEGAELARRHGIDRAFGSFLRLNAAELMWNLGRWDEMAEQLREVEAVDPIGNDVWRLCGLRGLLAAGRGRYDEARLEAEAIRAAMGTGSRAGRRYCLGAGVRRSLALGRRPRWSGRTRTRRPRPPGARHAAVRRRGHSGVARRPGRRADNRDPATAEEFVAMLDSWVDEDRWAGGVPGNLDAVRRLTAAEVERGVRARRRGAMGRGRRRVDEILDAHPRGVRVVARGRSRGAHRRS